MTVKRGLLCAFGIVCACLLFIQFVFSPAIYFGVLNYLGPSTEYYEPTITGAVSIEDGKYVAHLGDKIFVNYIVVRHRINGACFMHVYRYGEEIGGPHNGRRHLLDYVELQFRGRDELMRPHWPLAGLILGYDVNKKGDIQKDKPLLENGQDSQEYALYVVARYYCNFMDFLFPRYLQGGVKPNETERVNIIIRRNQ